MSSRAASGNCDEATPAAQLAHQAEDLTGGVLCGLRRTKQRLRDILRVVEIGGRDRFVRRHEIEAITHARRDAREPHQRVDERAEARGEVRAPRAAVSKRRGCHSVAIDGYRRASEGSRRCSIVTRKRPSHKR